MRHHLVPARLQLIPQGKITLGVVVILIVNGFALQLLQSQHVETSRKAKFLVNLGNFQVRALKPIVKTQAESVHRRPFQITISTESAKRGAG